MGQLEPLFFIKIEAVNVFIMCALPGELVLSDVHRDVYHPAESTADKSKTVLSRFYFVIKLDDQGEKEKRGGCSSHLDEDGDLIIAKRQERTTTEVITIEHMMSTEVSRVGLQVWMASFLLCDFIISNSSLFTSQYILELGSGTGISSILLASLDVAGVFCTDTGNDVLMQCNTNISHNGHMTGRKSENVASEALSKVIVRELDWTQDALNQDCQNLFHWRKSDLELLRKVSVIIAADVVYDNDLTDAFFKTLTRLMKDYNIRWAFLALEKRINFSLDELDVSSFAHDHFLDCLEILKETEEFDCQQLETSFPKCFDYTRTKELELWQITFSHVK